MGPRAREGGETVAFLMAEGYGLQGMTSEFAGFVPKQQLVQKMPDFCVKEDVAVFRQDHSQVLRQIQSAYAVAADRLRAALAEI